MMGGLGVGFSEIVSGAIESAIQVEVCGEWIVECICWCGFCFCVGWD